MRSLFLFFMLIVFISFPVLALNKVNLSSGFGKTISSELKPFFELSEGQIEDVLEGHVVSDGKVDSPAPKQQQMSLHVAGVHPRNCQRAMRKLSLYENYADYMSFIKKSSYDEKTQRLTFSVDHALLPFPMVVSFKLERITKAGAYPFVFENGFLKNLKGTVIVKDLGKFCLMGLKTDWKGPESRIPNVVFSSFVQTVGKLGLEHLIRVSIL